jgi:methionyl-tRNA synthetase
VSEETGNVVEWTSEINYKFRLSKFQDQLLQFYSENPEWILPESRMNEVIHEVKNGLMDISISRPSERVQWGIPVPDDPDQTIYVWLDALLNYPVQTGYPSGSIYQNGWPADLHVIGKDILRFHCIYWPAFLMALELPLPRHVLSHAHWTLGRSKMSKSRGNVVNPFHAIDTYSVDVIRWFLTHDGGIADDADYNNLRIAERYRQLKGGLGNLVTRVTRGKHWNVEEAVRMAWSNEGFAKQRAENDEDFLPMWNTLVELEGRVAKCIDRYDARGALMHIMAAISMVCFPGVP